MKKDDYILDAVSRMTALGLYKPEFDPAIARYADMMEQYETLTARWKRESYRAYAKTDDDKPSKRNPLLVAIESLRKDLTNLESTLGLNPQGLLKTNEGAFKQQKVSALADALKELSK